METYEMYVPRGYFIQLGNFSEDDFRIFTQTHSIKADDRGYYPVFEIVSRLNLARKKGKWGTGDADTALKMARIQQIRLQTGIKSKEYIPTKFAIDRMKSMLIAVANKIRYAIKSTSPRLILIPDAHQAEIILTDGYNSAIESLREEADQITTWEQYGVDCIADGNQSVEDTGEDTGVESSGETPTIG